MEFSSSSRFTKTVDSVDEDEEFDPKDTEAVGQEFVNKIEVNYCSLCREYLLRTSKDEKVIADHCKSKKHLKWYYQSKKKDEKLASSKSGEAMDVSKEDGTSAQESDKVSKKQASSEKEVKTADVKETAEGKEENDDNSKKFTR